MYNTQTPAYQNPIYAVMPMYEPAVHHNIMPEGIEQLLMPNKDGTGPKGDGPRDGRGRGKGNRRDKGAGKKKGGKKGPCKD